MLYAWLQLEKIVILLHLEVLVGRSLYGTLKQHFFRLPSLSMLLKIVRLHCRWIGAVSEFLSVLHSSPYIHGQQQIESTGVHSSLESSIDKFPYINIMEDGLVTALINDEPNNNEATALLDARTKLHCCSPLSPKLVIVVNKKKVLPHSFIEERRHQGTSKQPRRGIKARHSCKAFADYFRLSQS
ncbi:uncharacterized protein LOC109822612 [Asparagus officinalis]|uniref:uncharacterized protein LOC109822612 n=1 Tax=Asparagus officinalis TaxID=4686 RepID=UPI00098E2A49|nr:uncharacterized protein LOC109822612 [Asparagus officinalis]